jgi:HEAT repeat protein
VRRALLALICLSGCINYCRFDAVLARARKGDRAAIAEAGELGRPRIPSTAERLPGILEAFQAVAPNLSSTSAETRLVAVEALRHLSERAKDIYRNDFPTVFESSLSDPSPEIRWRACWAKGRLAESSVGLRTAASDPDDLVAEAACEALAVAHDAEALKGLVAALDRAAPVSSAATLALVRITGRELPDVGAWRAYVAERESRRASIADVGS